MKTKIIRTEQEYNDACERVYALINSTDALITPDSSKGEELELLSLLIEKYEQEKSYKLNPPSPIEAIKFRMEQMNLKQADVAPIFGGKTRVSEVLHGKRRLNLKTITLLNRYLGIPLESLVKGNKEIKLDSKKKEQLLNVSSIKEYLTKNNRAAIL